MKKYLFNHERGEWHEKKLLTMILALLTVFALSVSAYAGPGGGQPELRYNRTVCTYPDIDE